MKSLPLFLALSMLTATTFAADGPMRHVVTFKFKKDAERSKVQKVEEDFASLKRKIDVIESLEWGTNVSPEKLDKGYTHVWILSFKSEKDRDAYLVHPDHKAFAGSLKDVLEDAIVIDFVAKK